VKKMIAVILAALVIGACAEPPPTRQDTVTKQCDETTHEMHTHNPVTGEHKCP